MAEGQFSCRDKKVQGVMVNKSNYNNNIQTLINIRNKLTNDDANKFMRKTNKQNNSKDRFVYSKIQKKN